MFGRRTWGPLIAGLGFGAATFVRPTLAIPLALIGLMYLIENRRDTLRYALGAALPLAGILIQNRWIWGTWFAGGYSEAGVGFSAAMPDALWGLLLGWWRGLFAYTPAFVVAFATWFLSARRIRERFERRFFFLGLCSIALILFYSKWSTWHGGLNQFGYRYLLDIVPFLTVLLAHGIARNERLRTVAIPLGVLSVMTMAFGAASNDFGWDATFNATRFVDASVGQAWIYFIDTPWWAALRLAGVAAMGVVLFKLAASISPSHVSITRPIVDEARS
jgi:hypothetical protein